jgi:plastocyanin domain-containing protein
LRLSSTGRVSGNETLGGDSASELKDSDPKGAVVNKTKLSIAVAVLLMACASLAMAKGKTAKTQDQVFTVEVTQEGFVPAEIKVKAGKPVKLVVTRKIDRTCATEIVIKDFGINKTLPLNQPVEVTFTPSKPGKHRFACGMDMIAGVILVE